MSLINVLYVYPLPLSRKKQKRRKKLLKTETKKLIENKLEKKNTLETNRKLKNQKQKQKSKTKEKKQKRKKLTEN